MDNIEKIQDIISAITINKRKSMIDTILEYSSDEFENSEDYIQLAVKNKAQLRKSLCSLIEWYLD